MLRARSAGSALASPTIFARLEGMTTDHDTTSSRQVWSNLLDYLPPDELVDVLGPQGQMMLERAIEMCPSVLMNEENLDALIVAVLVEVHGEDPILLVQ